MGSNKVFRCAGLLYNILHNDITLRPSHTYYSMLADHSRVIWQCCNVASSCTQFGDPVHIFTGGLTCTVFTHYIHVSVTNCRD